MRRTTHQREDKMYIKNVGLKTDELICKLGRIEDVADELGTFLIYLDCCRMGAEGNLEGEGYVAIRNMLEQYPQFRNIKAEVKKFLDILEAEV